MPGCPLYQGQGLKAGQWAGWAWSPQWEGSLAPLPPASPWSSRSPWARKQALVTGQTPHHHQRPGVNGHPSFPRPSSTSAPQRPGDTGGKAELTNEFHILCATDPWKDREAGWNLPDKTTELSHQLHSPQGKAETSLSVQTTHLPAQALAEMGEISPWPALRSRDQLP